jgi:hypothetical protein
MLELQFGILRGRGEAPPGGEIIGRDQTPGPPLQPHYVTHRLLDQGHCPLWLHHWWLWILQTAGSKRPLWNNFRLTKSIEKMKRAMLIGSSRWRVGSEKAELKRVVRSIPELGVKAGSFNVMERESTLIFLDFSVQQIIDLLLAY